MFCHFYDIVELSPPTKIGITFTHPREPFLYKIEFVIDNARHVQVELKKAVTSLENSVSWEDHGMNMSQLSKRVTETLDGSLIITEIKSKLSAKSKK